MSNQTASPETDELRETADAYMRAAIWTESGPDADKNSGEPCLDFDYTIADFSMEAKLAAVDVVAKFISENKVDLAEWEPGQIGHDLWLTRNGHGTGFWDREWGHEDARERLTESSKALGETSCYFSDGEIHWGY